MLGAEHGEAAHRVDQHQHGGVGVEPAIMQDPGLLELQVVAGRAAEQRDIAERRIEGADHRLLADRQAVDQEQRELAAQVAS